MESMEPDTTNWFRRPAETPRAESRATGARTTVATDYAGFGLDRMGWRATRPQRRRTMTAISASLCAHLLLGLGLFLQHADPPFGAIGPDIGTGMQVSLVSGFAAGGPDAGKLDASEPEAVEERDPSPPKILEALGGARSDLAERMPAERQEPAQPPSKASLARGEAGQAAGAFEGAVGASNAKGGDSLAVSDLMAQIARCLRPGVLPALRLSQLTVSIGPDGRLRARPLVTSVLPQISAADRLAADQIVQAALLCGPYAHPDALNKTVTLPADFSAVRTTVAATETGRTAR